MVVKDANSSLTTFAVNGVRARESKTIRRIGFAILHPPSSILAVKDGSSTSTVFTPTRIASLADRNFIPYPRAFSPVIHFDSPLAVAIFPSSVIAAFTVTNGVR